jgi:uncharacterized membrane-anchored protein YitT (DUF2179 family)
MENNQKESASKTTMQIDEDVKKQLKEITNKRTVHSYVLVVLGTMLYSFGVVWLLQLGDFYSGGVTGISQLIVGLVRNYSSNASLSTFFSNNLGTFILLINIPLLIFGWKGLSKKFAILTIISILLQTICCNLLSTFTISPFALFLTGQSGIGEGIISAFQQGQSIFKSASETSEIVTNFKETILPGTKLLLAIFGGMITGIGASMCLKSGGSTGGLDIISNYLVMKKRMSFTKVQTCVDTVVICLSSLISVENVLYTLIRLAIYMKVVEQLYQIYRVNRLEIITTKAEDIRIALLHNFAHGMTIYEAIGGYTMTNKKSIEIYASSYEVHDYMEIIKAIDPGAFIISTKVKVLRGNYIQHTIV